MAGQIPALVACTRGPAGNTPAAAAKFGSQRRRMSSRAVQTRQPWRWRIWAAQRPPEVSAGLPELPRTSPRVRRWRAVCRARRPAPLSTAGGRSAGAAVHLGPSPRGAGWRLQQQCRAQRRRLRALPPGLALTGSTPPAPPRPPAATPTGRCALASAAAGGAPPLQAALVTTAARRSCCRTP